MAKVGIRIVLAVTLSVLMQGSLCAQDLKALGFGVALGFRWNVLEPDLVDDVTIDPNGIVRVGKRLNTKQGFMLETHYFPWRSQEFGHGPFVSAQPGSDDLIESIGFGWMAGWKVPNTTRAFAIGVGWTALQNAKVLGDEFVEGQPAPRGPNREILPVRYQERDKGSLLGILSFVF